MPLSFRNLKVFNWEFNNNRPSYVPTLVMGSLDWWPTSNVNTLHILAAKTFILKRIHQVFSRIFSTKNLIGPHHASFFLFASWKKKWQQIFFKTLIKQIMMSPLTSSATEKQCWHRISTALWSNLLHICLYIYWKSLFIITIYVFRHVSRSVAIPTAPRLTTETDAKMAKTLHINVSSFFWHYEFI